MAHREANTDVNLQSEVEQVLRRRRTKPMSYSSIIFYLNVASVKDFEPELDDALTALCRAGKIRIVKEPRNPGHQIAAFTLETATE